MAAMIPILAFVCGTLLVGADDRRWPTLLPGPPSVAPRCGRRRCPSPLRARCSPGRRRSRPTPGRARPLPGVAPSRTRAGCDPRTCCSSARTTGTRLSRAPRGVPASRRGRGPRLPPRPATRLGPSPLPRAGGEAPSRGHLPCAALAPSQCRPPQCHYSSARGSAARRRVPLRRVRPG